jgi:uncharacterized RDD family membrane protein YckC
MKCPKCHYVSFEPEPRCRNCGYGFALVEGGNAPGRAAVNPPAVFAPRAVPPSSAAAPAPRPAAAQVPTSIAGRAGDAAPQAPDRAAPRAVPPPEPPAERPFASAALAEWEPELVRTSEPPAASELPLFGKSRATDAASASSPFGAVDEPLVRVPAEPRPPLAVRRPVPDAAPAARPAAARQPSRRLGPLDRDLLEDLERIERAERAGPRLHGTPAREADRDLTSIGGGLRLAAAAIDALVIGGLSAGVLWLTLRWCELPFEQMSMLPALPMLAFLTLGCLGYLLMFTAAGGQTIGKMACGLRVIGEADAAGTPSASTLTASQAAWRVVLSIASVLTLGLGLLPAVLGRDEAIHDRLAHTRVVRV